MWKIFKVPYAMIQLPNNRLILNGHKILNEDQLIAYINKRLHLYPLIHTLEDIKIHLDGYISIAIRHGDSFLEQEEDSEKDRILHFLQQHRNTKISYSISTA